MCPVYMILDVQNWVRRQLGSAQRWSQILDPVLERPKCLMRSVKENFTAHHERQVAGCHEGRHR